MTAAENINYLEHTGPFTRVLDLERDEETACRIAMERLSTPTTPTITDVQPWGWEVVFETADL